MSYIAKNDAYSSLAGAITDGDTNATVQPGDGDRFPVIENGDYTLATLEDDFGNREIIKITLREAASDTISFNRAQEGTTARAWPSGTIIEVRPTAALMNAAIAHFDNSDGAHQASAIAVLPIGNISADNVQDTLAELAAEKAAVSQLNAASISYAGTLNLPDSTVEVALDTLDAIKLTKDDKAVNTADLADSIVSGLPVVTFADGDYVFIADADDALKPKRSLMPPIFPSGTRMVFHQSAAPVGWTKDTSAALNDSLMRIVTGNVGAGGGAVNFSTFNAITATGGHVLTLAQIPQHAHSDYYQRTNVASSVPAGGGGGIIPQYGVGSISETGLATTTGSAGSGQAHSHPVTYNIKYNDFIIAQKD